MRPRWASRKWFILRGLALIKPWDSGPIVRHSQGQAAFQGQVLWGGCFSGEPRRSQKATSEQRQQMSWGHVQGHVHTVCMALVGF